MNTIAEPTSARDVDSEDTLECAIGRLDYPTLYIVASDASRAGQRQYVWLVRLELALIVLAAGFSAFAPFVTDNWARIVAVPIAVFLLSGVIVRSVSELGDQDRLWFDGRSAAESVKTTTWRFMMRVNPYNADVASSEHQFHATLKTILDASIALRQEVPTVPGVAITPQMKQVRMLPLHTRRACYLKYRVEDQITWYSGKSETNRRLARAWFWVGILAQGAALVAALIGIMTPDALNLVGLFAAAAAAATASLQLRRHDELAKSYGVAAHELRHLARCIEHARREKPFQELVDDAESAISREHTLWVAKRGQQALLR